LIIKKWIVRLWLFVCRIPPKICAFDAEKYRVGGTKIVGKSAVFSAVFTQLFLRQKRSFLSTNSILQNMQTITHKKRLPKRAAPKQFIPKK
jgi:hypothetical protein